MCNFRQSYTTVKRGLWEKRIVKNKDVFYQVVQNGNSVGYFREKSNALKYIDQFNTKVEIAPLKIVERDFLDNELETDSFHDDDFNWSAWD